MKKFPFVQQLGIKDCGPACLKMISKWYGKSYDINYLRQKSHITKLGVSMLGISESAEAIGYRTMGVKIRIDQLKKAVGSGPLIVHWRNNHFVVLFRIKNGKFHVADPAKSIIAY
ncbi:MAG: peptidase domain-containing ABC transporter, partial [Bacteroidia bacterium]|nr:peptidase domain-containing ABC transporter [Bacteroidia bacterium]